MAGESRQGRAVGQQGRSTSASGHRAAALRFSSTFCSCCEPTELEAAGMQDGCLEGQARQARERRCRAQHGRQEMRQLPVSLLHFAAAARLATADTLQTACLTPHNDADIVVCSFVKN